VLTRGTLLYIGQRLILIAFTVPGYSSISQHISELALLLHPIAAVQRISAIVTGVSVLVFGVGLVLVPESSDHALASMKISTRRDGDAPTTLAEPTLEEIRIGNPAARSLPLLVALAGASPVTIRIPATPGMLLEIGVVPS